MANGTCSVEGCDLPTKAKGMCSPHYQRWSRYGRTNKAPRTSPAERLERLTRRDPSGCWVFTGSLNLYGYGDIKLAGRSKMKAHRLAYELAVGPIPEGLVIDHLCRNRACVNPAHLEPVTNRENNLRGVGPAAVNAAKTHCKHGHEFTPENTIVAAGGRRSCRTCRKEVQRRFDQRRSGTTERNRKRREWYRRKTQGPA